MPTQKYESDVIIAGGGLAGIATAIELLDHNRRVILLERDAQENFGGLAKKSFGGIMFVDTPLQRKLGIRDTPELALSDWHQYANFGEKDILPKQWAKTYVERSRDLIYDWLTRRSVSFLPLVNWPERGLFRPGNSVPRWHIAWGTGYAITEALLHHLETHPRRKNLAICFDHQVNQILRTSGSVCGCAGIHEKTGTEFEAAADALVIASGGICGGDLRKVRANWYKEWGNPPKTLLNGSHRFADGLLHDAVEKQGGALTHLDKQWHYPAGIPHPHAQMPNEGLSLVPPRSALWMDACGRRFAPMPLMGYTDTRYNVERITTSPAQYSWQVLNWKIAIKELAVSGCDYMTAFRHKKKFQLLKNVLFGDRELVRRLLKESKDMVTADSLSGLAEKMDGLSLDGFRIDKEGMLSDIRAYDAQIERGCRYFNDEQLRRIANFRNYRGDRLRTCCFQKIDDPKARPLIAIREFILSRKSLGGIQTDLQSRVLDANQQPVPGLYAAGEAAGFGGGGIHGKGSLEGTFLGSCILTGRIAGRAIAGKNL